MPKTFIFDMGDSTNGPVGYVARAKAKNVIEARGVLREVMPTEGVEVSPDDRVSIRVYLNDACALPIGQDYQSVDQMGCDYSEDASSTACNRGTRGCTKAHSARERCKHCGWTRKVGEDTYGECHSACKFLPVND